MADSTRRGAWLGVGLGGLLSALAVPTVSGAGGCILPDNCIAFPQPTVDVCKRFENAVNLTTGLPLLDETGAVPRGCQCMEQADADVLIAEDADPDSAEYQLLAVDLDGRARTACVEVALTNGLGADETNCITADEVVGPIQDGGPGACESRFCDFAPEPVFGSCPEDGSLCPGASPPSGTGGPEMTDEGSAGPATDSTATGVVDSSG